jgi:hypothetical protein
VELWTRYHFDPRQMTEIILQELQRRTAFMRRRAAQAGTRQDAQNAENQDKGTSEER